LRIFNNARTASRNRDLAIRAPISSPALPTAQADSSQCVAATTADFFWQPPVRQGVILFPVWSADTERTRFWSNCIKCLRYIRNILIFWLNLVPQKGLRPERAKQ
jgi:hypothetical protein